MYFGNVLRNLMEEREISQKELAQQLNLAVSTVGNYINMHREPDYETLKKIADFFNVSIDYLLGHINNEGSTENELYLVKLYRSMTKEQKNMFLLYAVSVAKYNNKNKPEK